MPTELADKARLAVANCPEYAITIHDDGRRSDGGRQLVPLSDWATDLDHADPAYNANAHAIWDELRECGCPVASSERYGGMWAPLTHELVHEVAYDTDHFTSNGV